MKTVTILLSLLSVLLLGRVEAQTSAKKTIGFLMDDFNATRWEHDSTILAKKIRSEGKEILIRICDSDTALQYKQALELLDAGVSALIVVPANATAASAIVQAANKKKVPVIAYDRLILNSKLDYFVSFDGERVGELQASFVLKQMNYQGNLVIMNGPEYDVNSLLFKKGQMNILKPYIESGKVKVVYDRLLSEWTSLEAYMESNDFLATYTGNIDGVIAANDALAQGVIEALSIFRPELKIPITGQDASVTAYYNILDNLQAMTVYKPIDSLASEAALLACALADNKKVKASNTVYNGLGNIPFLKLEPILISQENVKTLLVKENYLSEEYLKRQK